MLPTEYIRAPRNNCPFFGVWEARSVIETSGRPHWVCLFQGICSFAVCAHEKERDGKLSLHAKWTYFVLRINSTPINDGGGAFCTPTSIRLRFSCCCCYSHIILVVEGTIVNRSKYIFYCVHRTLVGPIYYVWISVMKIGFLTLLGPQPRFGGKLLII